MLGTTREFLDYFGLKKLDDLPTLAEIRELGPRSDPQSDFVDELEALMRESDVQVQVEVEVAEEAVAEDAAMDDAEADDTPAESNVIPIQQSEA
jgi:segregation and condensation protein B